MIKDRTVLVLEDERPLIQAIRKKMEQSGLSIISARSVDQGIGYLEDLDSVDVIWLDHYLLGQENGLDFVAQVKNHPEWKNIPLFVVSNTATDEKVSAYIEFGVTEYLTKSDHRLDEIIGRMKSAIE